LDKIKRLIGVPKRWNALDMNGAITDLLDVKVIMLIVKIIVNSSISIHNPCESVLLDFTLETNVLLITVYPGLLVLDLPRTIIGCRRSFCLSVIIGICPFIIESTCCNRFCASCSKELTVCA